jgi:hypothetical protein
MPSQNSAAEPRLQISVVAALSLGFLAQFAMPLVAFGSTALGALLWVAVSAAIFLVPCLLLRSRAADTDWLLITLYVFLLPAIFIAISNALNGKFDGRALAELFRAPYFLLAFFAGVKLAGDRSLLKAFVARTFPWVVALLIGYLVASFVTRDFIDDVEVLYGKIENAVRARLFAPFPNPYDLALFCLLPLFYYALERKKVAALSVSAVLLATQSRTGVLLCIFGFTICALVSRFARRRTLSFALLVLSLLVALVLLVFDLEQMRSIYLISNTLGLFEGQSTTLARRFVQWSYLQDLPLLGWGTIRSVDLVIENAIIYELYRMGILGLYTLFVFYVLPAALALRVIATARNDSLQLAFGLFVLLTILGFGSSVFIYQPKMSLLYWFSVGILYSYATDQRTRSTSEVHALAVHRSA